MMELSIEEINSKIFEIRGQKVMLDKDLAIFYGVETKVLNQAVKRNIERFPIDFMFRLTKEEFENLKSQFVTSSWGGVRKLSYAFTEQGISMLSAVLKSKVAIDISIQIMRTFVEMRKYALTHNELAKKIEELEKRVSKGEEVDTKIMEIVIALISQQKTLQEQTPSKTDGKIGFVK